MFYFYFLFNYYYYNSNYYFENAKSLNEKDRAEIIVSSEISIFKINNDYIGGRNLKKLYLPPDNYTFELTINKKENQTKYFSIGGLKFGPINIEGGKKYKMESNYKTSSRNLEYYIKELEHE